MRARFRAQMTKLGFTLAGADHPIIPVMLGDAAARPATWPTRMLDARRLRHRLLLPGGAEGPGPHPHADVGRAFAGRTSTGQSRPLPKPAVNSA